MEIFGINGNNYGNFVLDASTWEARYGIPVASLQRGVLPSAVPAASPVPAPSAPAAAADIPYQQIRGYEVGIGTLNLPRGQVVLQLEFGGWGAGPVTVTYQVGGAAPVHLLNNQRVPYYSEIVLSVPQAATYTFRVSATRNWHVWVGLEPGLPSVPLPIQGCQTLMRWHQAEEGVHRSRYDCGGDRLDGKSYAAINTDAKHWAVWYVNNRFFGVTSTGAVATTADRNVAYQAIRGYNNGSGVLTLPAGPVTIKIEYSDWRAGPISVTYSAPSGERVRLIDAERIPFGTNRTINAAQAGAYSIQVNAQGSWRLWVGEDVGEVADLLKNLKSPGDCDLKDGTPWRQIGGVHRAEYECTAQQKTPGGDPVYDDKGNPVMVVTNTWHGAQYPGLNTTTAFWVVWTDKDQVLRVTRHNR